MEWFKVESAIYDHPKLDGLSAGAFRGLVFAWAYVARHELGGKLPDTAPRRLGLTKGQIGELEGRGLIHRNGTGWVIHDWDEHQEDAEALSRLRASARRRKAQERARRREEAA